MEGFTVIDAIVAGVIVISAILAYSRGLVRELMAIAGWIAAAVLAFLFAPAATPLVREIPYLSDFIGESCELAIIAAFAGVFAIALLVVSIFTPLLSVAVQRSAIGGLDAALGFLFGAARGALLVLVAFIAYERIATDPGVPMVEESRSINVFAGATEQVEDLLPEDAPEWILARYEELIGDCGAPGGESEARLPLPPRAA